jgi:transcriptional regulator with XRE-family HTH domain
MAGTIPEAGPIGRNLIANVDQLRQARGLSWNKLSAALEAAGRPIPPLGLSRMAKGERRVDVDELVALAQVLKVAPADLLQPPDSASDDKTPDHAALSATQKLTSRITDLLAATPDPAAAQALSGYVDLALRRVQVEVEELLAEAARPGQRSRD